MSPSDPTEAQAVALAESIANAVDGSFLRIAVAEALTSGTVAARLGAAPRSADWFAGGVVAVSTESKRRVLEVGSGPVVSARAAEQMATSVARLFGANLALAITGVGGPERESGEAVGTVFIGVRSPHGDVHVAERSLGGSPAEIADSAVVAALRLLEARVHALIAQKSRTH
ncbi:MAG: CinA family protein [Mycetocola sp.]